MKHNKWMKKLLAFAAIACLLMGSLPATVLATEEAAEEQVEATEFVIPEDAVYLSTPEDLLVLAENCIHDAWSRDKVVVLKNDINLSGTDFAGIPTFGGTFLGQGFSVSGLRLTQQQTVTGFFRYLQKGAVVEELNLRGTVHPSKNKNPDIGGIAGINHGTIRNCSFSGTVSGSERIGGIAGCNTVSGIIENCTVSGTVYGDHYIGGITGENTGVIRGCVNQAKVNTQVDHNSVSALTGLSLESITARESISDATNIGGIAGTSSGVIRGCENRAAIGYEKIGYNVGGIAGSQIGYLTECTNYAPINGSDGVGGIVGQFKPNVVLEFGENLMNTLTEQMTGMMGSMSGLMGSMSGMMDDMADNMAGMEEAIEQLKNSTDPDSLNAAMNELSSSFNEIFNAMSASGSEMTGKMQGMMGSMNQMVGTMEKLNEGMNLTIIDISREDTPENTLTKVSNCENHGTVCGETYVGGIAGIADIEDTTAKDEIEGTVNFSNEGEIIMRLVIRDCRNNATVSASKQYAGGIVGNMTIGAIFGGMNTGSIDALNADYAGGIVGSCEAYIIGSASRAVLAGSSYVGGIAGYGTEVIGCYAITDLTASGGFAGGILGHTDPLPDEENALITNNYYYLTGENVGGIDGIRYEGATAPMTVQEFLAAEATDDSFRTVTVRFVAEGYEDVVRTAELGKSLALAKIPHLETEEHEQYRWELVPTVSTGSTDPQYISKERLSNLLFDQTYVAVFDAKNTVVASRQQTDSGRPLALAVGAFDADIILSLTESDERNTVVEGVSVQECLQVSISDIGVERLHYHIPEGMDAQGIVLYVKDISGNWVQRSFDVEGSYMIFDFTHGETAFALDVPQTEELSVATIVVVAGVVLLLLVGAKTHKKHKKMKKGIAVEEK